MSQKIGPREQALREQRERESQALDRWASERRREALAAALPATSGRKPVKKKRRQKT